MDPLSDVLRTSRLMGGVFLHAEFSEPWCLGVRVLPESCAPFLGQAIDVIPYHYVLEGRLRGRVGDGPIFECGPGQLAMFPRNDYHLLGGDLRLPPVPSKDVVTRPADGALFSIRMGGGGARTRIVCGYLAGDQLGAGPIVNTLPAVLHLDYSHGASAEWIRSTFHFAAAEIAAGRLGSETIFAKISELLFVEGIRHYAEQMPDGQTGWLAGLRDPFVSRALAVLHGRLRDPWTVDKLGREVGMSRSALGARFLQVIGKPPMQYLARWRIQVAAQELRHTGKPIARIADEVGYDSEASLTRAFKRVMGIPPASWRRQQQ
jgi:AraC-like DNA-binding protein